MRYKEFTNTTRFNSLDDKIIAETELDSDIEEYETLKMSWKTLKHISHKSNVLGLEWT